MAQTNTAKKSKAGKEITCGRCGAVIQPGETYFHWTPFRSNKRVRCHKHPPRQSEKCTSMLSGAYAANEDVEDCIEEVRAGKCDIKGLASVLESAADDICSVRDDYQNSLDSMGDNFANGEPGQQIQEKIDGLESHSETLRNAAEEIRGIEIPDEDPEDKVTDTDKAKDKGESAEEQATDEAIDKAEDALGEFSL